VDTKKFIKIAKKKKKKKTTSSCTKCSTNFSKLANIRHKIHTHMYIYKRFTNIPAFPKIGQETPILEEHISASHKLHIIRIQTRVQDLPVPLVPSKAQLSESGPSRLGRGRPINALNWVILDGFQKPESPSEVLALHCLLILPPFTKGCSRSGGEEEGLGYCINARGRLEEKKRKFGRKKVWERFGL
jgi:hypothetical protein